jgi:hypothetical protein
VNSCMKNSVSPHILALHKMLVDLRWLIWHTLLKVEDDPELRHNVIIVRKLGTLPNIAARNSAIIVRRRVIFLGIVVHALRNAPLLLSELLFNPRLCLHLPHILLFRVLLPTLLPSRSTDDCFRPFCSWSPR